MRYLTGNRNRQDIRSNSDINGSVAEVNKLVKDNKTWKQKREIHTCYSRV